MKRAARQRKDEWTTPIDFFEPLNARYGFTLDVASTHKNALCVEHFTKADDGLGQPWDGVVWCNPPYSDPAPWLAKAHASSLAGATVVMLLPLATPGWYWNHAVKGEIHPIRGRLRFGGAPNVAPFDSMLVVFRNSADVTEVVV